MIKAKEFLKAAANKKIENKLTASSTKEILDEDEIILIMQVFAKLHVKEALKTASNNVEMEKYPYTYCQECCNGSTYVNRDSILNSYPESNII